MRKTRRRSALVCLPPALALAGAALAYAPGRAAARHVRHAAVQKTADPAMPAIPGMVLEAGSGRVFETAHPIANLFAADPKIAEVRPASPTSVFVFGVAPGRTTIAGMDAAGHVVAQYEITVRPSGYAASEVNAALARALPGSRVTVTGTPSGLVASGTVATAEDAERVLAVLKEYAGEKQTIDSRVNVVSSQQVNLRVRVAEISRAVTRQLGINWSALGTIGRVAVVGSITDGLSDPTNLPNALGLAYNFGSFSLGTVVDLLAQDGLIRILAEPNLTARSGETASFLAGGEFPIPIAEQNNTVSITFKQYGVSLAFVPTVLGPDRISLKVRPEVSELTNQGAVTLPVAGVGGLFGASALTIPALSVRRAETTVELGSGQSFAIAGLMQSQANMTKRGLPYLGEIPILGPLFSSDLFQRNESELVIIVTPYLVRPASSPAQLAAPTDNFTPANDAERVLYGRQRASDATAPSRAVVNAGFILN